MSIFKIHYVPTDDPVLSGFLAGKLAALRLQALTVSAEAFGGQFVSEIFAHMPYTQWIERLRRPHVHTLVVIAYPDGTTEEDQTVDKGDVVGTAVVIGPVLKIGYEMASLSELEVGEDDQETKWHCTALYCSPYFRSKGLGKMLVNARIGFAKAASKTEKVRIRVLVNVHNTKVLEPVKALGFVTQGKCTPAEAIHASGDDILLPSDGEANHTGIFTDRRVFVLELKTTK